jgi:UDP-glucuronate 4-epimerase
MKILVTGAAGFIGSHLAEALSRGGHDVVGVDAFTPHYAPELKEQNARLVEAAGGRVVRCDLATDPLDGFVPGVQVVFHLAGAPGLSATTSFAEYERNNVLATHRLVEAFRGAPLTLFVNVSSSSVYGADATGPESVAPMPTSWYGVTKLAAEQLVMAAARSGALPGMSMRIFSVYGPRERPDKLFPKLIRAVAAGAELPLHQGAEHHERSFTFVGDVVAGLCAAMARPERCVGELVNLGTPTSATTMEAIRIVERHMGRAARLRTVPARPGDQARTHANIERARRLFDYAPGTSLDDGLAAEVAWFGGPRAAE